MAAESTLVEVATDPISSSSPRTDDNDQTKAPGFGVPPNYYPPWIYKVIILTRMRSSIDQFLAPFTNLILDMDEPYMHLNASDDP